MNEATQIAASDFQSQREANPTSVVIDVRDHEKFEEAHIPTAIHIHKTKIAEEIADIVPDKTTEIFCYCGGGQSGPRTAELLNDLGYTNAKAIDGGYRAYKASIGEKE